MRSIMFLAALPLLLSCDRADKGASPVPQTTSGVSAPIDDKQSDISIVKAPIEFALPSGRWRSDHVCLEIFANGDFEISLPTAKSGKELIMGQASRSDSAADKAGATDTVFDLALQVKGIWRARYLGRCRKVHKTGHWVEQTRAFGATVHKGKALTLQMRQLEEGKIELCPKVESSAPAPCTTLMPDKALLGKNWKREGDQQTVEAGVIVGIELGPQGYIALQKSDGFQNRIYGSLVPIHISKDEFSLSFIPAKDRLKGKPSILGVPVETRLELTATRLAGQQVQLCTSPDKCVRLDREFNSYAYEIDYHVPNEDDD